VVQSLNFFMVTCHVATVKAFGVAVGCSGGKGVCGALKEICRLALLLNGP
jgi:hypothetical protein